MPQVRVVDQLRGLGIRHQRHKLQIMTVRQMPELLVRRHGHTIPAGTQGDPKRDVRQHVAVGADRSQQDVSHDRFPQRCGGDLIVDNRASRPRERPASRPIRRNAIGCG
jgi:hypothetical protein